MSIQRKMNRKEFLASCKRTYLTWGQDPIFIMRGKLWKERNNKIIPVKVTASLRYCLEKRNELHLLDLVG
jgi:hypothetical protein